MKKTLIALALLQINFMHAATLTTNKTTYSPTDGAPIEVTFKEMTGLNKDWIAIYPAGTDNAWSNVIKWKFTGDKASGKLTLVTSDDRNTLKNGKYEARAFYNNSYKLETKVAFEIKGEKPNAPKILPLDKVFTEDSKIYVSFSNMTNANKDWIAIYPAGASNAFSNVLDWKWTGDKPEGDLRFKSLPKGDYEIRAFYNNSAATVYAKATFTVIGKSHSLWAAIKGPFLFFSYRNEGPSDWIGIYKKNDSVAWNNVIKWKWLKDIRHGESVHISGAGAGPNHIDLEATHMYKDIEDNLPKGQYEARVFKNNSFIIDKSYEFTIK